MATGSPLNAERDWGRGNPTVEANEDSNWSTRPWDVDDDFRVSRSEVRVSQGPNEELSLSKNEATSMIRRRAALAQAEGAMMVVP